MTCLQLADELDPDSFIQKADTQAQAFESFNHLITNTPSIEAFFVDRFFIQCHDGSIGSKSMAFSTMKPVIKKIKHSVLKEQVVTLLNNELGIDVTPLC